MGRVSDLARAVERLGQTLETMGLQRMPARVFAFILADDQSVYTAAELARGLDVSPAAISGAVRYLADTLVEIGDSVPETPEGFRLASRKNLAEDRAWLAPKALPAELFVAPGTKAPNRQGFATFAAWLNATAAPAIAPSANATSTWPAELPLFDMTRLLRIRRC